MVNYSGILALPSILFKPGLILPHLSVKDIRYLDWKALKSIGINTVVFDKDNCLTKPLKDAIVPQLENSLLDCIRTFGFANVVILSNSSGSSDDPNSIGAESLSRNLLSSSKIQVMLHENKKPSTQCAQEVFDWYSENQKRSNESSSSQADEGLARILFVGDRPTTDIITGHRISQIFKKRSSDVLKRRGLGTHQDACLTVLTTNLWEKEKLGTRFMRSLEYKMVRYFARKGLEPGKSWKKEKRREIELDSNEMSFSSSSKGSRVEKVGLGLVSNQRPWQFSGIVKSQLSKERTTSNNDDVSSSTDLAISIRDHSPEPKFSNLISSVLPFSLQPFFKNFIRFTSIWPIRPMLDLMRDGWHLILKGSKIGIHSEGFFRDVSKRKREEDLKEKIDEHAFLGWDSNQRTRGSIKRRRNNQLFAESSFAPEDELMTRSHQRRRFSSSSSSTSIYSINSISKSNLKGLDSTSLFNLKKSSLSSTNPNRTFSTTKASFSSSSTSKLSPPNSNPSRLPSKNWLAAIAALFLIPTCYLLGARLHEYREESMALKEEERIRKTNQGLNQGEVVEKMLREEREKESRIKRGVEREREERMRSLELAHFHLSHEKKEVEEKLARLRERRVEEERERDTPQTTRS